MQESTPQFRPVRPRRVFEEIADQIRTRLATGALRPGDKLPAERQLAEELKVGRNAVREALRTLEMAGLIELRKGTKGGAFIKQGDPAVVAETMSDQLRLGGITLENLTEVRLWIQTAVTRVAAERATEADLAALTANVEEAERLFRAGEFEQKAEVHIDFHILLAKATQNPMVVPIVASLMQTMRHFVHWIGAERHDETLRSRRRLLEFLRRRDAKGAVAEMTSHLLSLDERYREVTRQRKAELEAAHGGKQAAATHLPRRRGAVRT